MGISRGTSQSGSRMESGNAGTMFFFLRGGRRWQCRRKGRWKNTTIMVPLRSLQLEIRPMFHWTMIMGGRVTTHLKILKFTWEWLIGRILTVDFSFWDGISLQVLCSLQQKHTPMQMKRGKKGVYLFHVVVRVTASKTWYVYINIIVSRWCLLVYNICTMLFLAIYT